MNDFHKEVLKCQLGIQTKTTALEALRVGLVYSMRIGDCFVINLDKTSPDLINSYTHDEIFPTEEIFDWGFWRADDHYMKVVKDEENHDLIGNKKMYTLRDKF